MLEDRQALLKFMEEIARQAGELMLAKQAAGVQKMSKGFRDIVTDADIATQMMLTQAIQTRYPTHGFITEEEDNKLPESGKIIWIIDPIDGTSNFGRKVPLFCVSIAAAEQTEQGLHLFAGVIYDPNRQELFSALEGNGATCNGHPMTQSAESEPIKTMMAVDWPRNPEQRAKMAQLMTVFLAELKTVRSFGTAALALAYVAAGRIEAYMHVSLRLWDVAAGLVLLQEVGGEISTLDGKNWKPDDTTVIATNQASHAFILDKVIEHL